MSERRPDPDELLSHVREAEEQARRGKLTIFFGSAPGDGKTYAMLEAARVEMSDVKRDVAVGLVETHGRYDTGSLLIGLELLPRRTLGRGERRRNLPHRGRADVDAPCMHSAPKQTTTLVSLGSHARDSWQSMPRAIAHGLNARPALAGPSSATMAAIARAAARRRDQSPREPAPIPGLDRTRRQLAVGIPVHDRAASRRRLGGRLNTWSRPLAAATRLSWAGYGEHAREDDA